MYLNLSQVRALAKANGIDSMRYVENALKHNIFGEIFCIYPEGTKIFRRKNDKGRVRWFLHGYTDADVPRTLARLATLPKWRKPKPKQVYQVFVNDTWEHWTGSFESCRREVKSLRATGTKAKIEIRKVA